MATDLARAELQALGPGAEPELIGSPIPVQFNPTSLRLQMANSVEGADSSARQARQYNGTSSTTLTVELVFDTADEGTTAEPVSVKQRTGRITGFLLPGRGSQEPPPRVRFHWGEFVLDGVMSALTEDLDLFSASGVPLRSKLNITIKEQDPRFTALQAGPGAGQTAPATEPGARGGGPGSGPQDAPTDSSREALGGESPPEFAARNGLDPSAWRAVAPGLDGLDLPAGASIGFSASASASLGLGVHAGVEAGLDASLAVSLGLESAAGAAKQAGFALSSAGGVTSAIATAQGQELGAAVDAARRAFGAAPGSGAAAGAGSTRAGSTAAPGRAGTDRPAVAGVLTSQPPTVDPRYAAFGRGVPLRPRVGTGSRATVAGQEASGLPPTTTDTTVPGWQALPTRTGWSAAADRTRSSGQRPSPCGHRSCSCGGNR